MATVNYAAQGQTNNIADQGQLYSWSNGGNNPTYLLRQGNSIYTTDLVGLGRQAAQSQGINVDQNYNQLGYANPTAAYTDLGNKYISGLGVKPQSVSGAFVPDTLQFFGSPQSLTTSMLSSFKPSTTTPEAFTSAPSQANPNAVNITSSTQGDVTPQIAGVAPAPQLGAMTPPTGFYQQGANAVPQPNQVLATTATAQPMQPVGPAPAPVQPIPTQNGSIVDFLNSQGKPSDFNSRAQLAQQYGIQNYTGTAEQNTQLLNTLRGGQSAQGGTPSPYVPAQVPQIDTQFLSQYLPPDQIQNIKDAQASLENLNKLSAAGYGDVAYNQIDPATIQALKDTKSNLQGEVASGGDTNVSIPNTFTSTDTSGQSRQSFLDEVTNYFNKQQQIQDQILKTTDLINQFETQALQKSVGIQGKTIPQPLIGAQLQQVQNQLAFQTQPLSDQLKTLQTISSNNQQFISNLEQLQKLTQPNIASTQYNQLTGEVSAVVQDPNTGQISMQSLGNIGAQKQYISTSTLRDATTGQNYMVGVKPDGGIDKIPLGVQTALPGVLTINPSGQGGYTTTQPAGGDIATPVENAYNQVSSKTSPANKGSQISALQSAYSQYSSTGNPTQLQNLLKQYAKDNTDATTAQQVTNRDLMVGAADNIKNLIEQAKAAGVNTNLITGKVNDIANKLGSTSNPTLQQLGNEMSQQLINYRRQFTGVAFSPQESAQYASLMPSIDNMESMNIANLNGLVDTAQSYNKTFYQQAMGADNYNAIFGNSGNPIGLQGANSGSSGTTSGADLSSLDFTF